MILWRVRAWKRQRDRRARERTHRWTVRHVEFDLPQLPLFESREDASTWIQHCGFPRQWIVVDRWEGERL